MKKLIIAIIIALVLMSCFGHLAESLFDMHVKLGEDVLSPLLAMGLIGLIGGGLLMFGLVIAVSVFGAIALAVLAALVGIFVAGVSVFWPIILAAVILIWLMSDKSQTAH